MYRGILGVAVSAACCVAGTLAAGAELIPDGAPTKNEFGTSVATDGQTIAVGAPANNPGTVIGSVYIFDAATMTQTARLTASDATPWDLFGFAVAVSSNTLVIGSPADDDVTANSGSVYVFDTNDGTQRFKLMAEVPKQDASFGWSVAVSGNRVIIGAGREGEKTGSTYQRQPGAAYVFDVTTGRQLLRLTDSNVPPGGVFGFSVGLSGETGIIGTLCGSAYLFDVTTGEELANLAPLCSSVPLGEFGRSVAICGDTAIVGMSSPEPGLGAAYLFDATTGEQLFELCAPEAASDTDFGRLVAITGQTAIVSGYLHNGNEHHRSAYLFDTTSGEYLGNVTAIDVSGASGLIESMAAEGNVLARGCRYTDDSGFAHAFTVPEPSTLALLAALVATALRLTRRH